MKNIRGDLFEIPCHAFCITTNGFVKKNGECVMGRGCAKEACKRWPSTARQLGDLIKLNGNITQPIYDVGKGPLYSKIMVAFPVKPVFVIFDGKNCVEHMKYKFKVGDTVPGWATKASLDLIKRSAKQLVNLTNMYGWKTVVIPRPGCGAGELSWNNVQVELEKILDDRFHSITY